MIELLGLIVNPCFCSFYFCLLWSQNNLFCEREQQSAFILKLTLRDTGESIENKAEREIQEKKII